MATAWYSDKFTYSAQTGLYTPTHRTTSQHGFVILKGTFTCPSALATNDTGVLFEMNNGDELVHYRHWYQDFGTTCTTSVTLGSTDLATNIALGTAVANTSATTLDTTYATDIGLMGKTNGLVTADRTQFKLTFTSVSTPTAGSTYNFVAIIVHA